MKHVWVRHTIEKIRVEKRPITMSEYDPPLDELVVILPNPNVPGNDSTSTVYGCDSCGLPLSVALFEEPCLSSLEDQVEEEA